MLALIARRSKYDFWIPDEILTLEIKIQTKKYFFEIENFDRKKIPEKKIGPKKFTHPKIKIRWEICSKNRFFRFLDRYCFLIRKKIRIFFSIKMFDLEKIFFDLNFYF